MTTSTDPVVPPTDPLVGPRPPPGAPMPALLYGCAWKKERTADLVFLTIQAGFRGIDTAAMRRHYDEAATGEGIRRAIAARLVRRADLFVQTKFTPGDDDVDPDAPVAAQVGASVAASLRHLATPDDPDGEPYLDCLVLHAPYPREADTRAAWAALAAFVPRRIRALGLGHASAALLAALPPPAPAAVQNRFTAREARWHAAVRRACRARRVVFQAFWTLTGNRDVWPKAACVRAVAAAAAVEPAAAWYALIVAAGMVVLDGTTDPAHMRADLDALDRVRAWRETEPGRDVWAGAWADFQRLVGGFEDDGEAETGL